MDNICFQGTEAVTIGKIEREKQMSRVVFITGVRDRERLMRKNG